MLVRISDLEHSWLKVTIGDCEFDFSLVYLDSFQETVDSLVSAFSGQTRAARWYLEPDIVEIYSAPDHYLISFPKSWEREPVKVHLPVKNQARAWLRAFELFSKEHGELYVKSTGRQLPDTQRLRALVTK